jgi:hypothetical protein
MIFKRKTFQSGKEDYFSKETKIKERFTRVRYLGIFNPNTWEFSSAQSEATRFYPRNNYNDKIKKSESETEQKNAGLLDLNSGVFSMLLDLNTWRFSSAPSEAIKSAGLLDLNTRRFSSAQSETIKSAGMLDLNTRRFSSAQSETIKSAGMLDLKPAGGFNGL